jgi:hypothetical protein
MRSTSLTSSRIVVLCSLAISGPLRQTLKKFPPRGIRRVRLPIAALSALLSGASLHGLRTTTGARCRIALSIVARRRSIRKDVPALSGARHEWRSREELHRQETERMRLTRQQGHVATRWPECVLGREDAVYADLRWLGDCHKSRAGAGCAGVAATKRVSA